VQKAVTLKNAQLQTCALLQLVRVIVFLSTISINSSAICIKMFCSRKWITT